MCGKQKEKVHRLRIGAVIDAWDSIYRQGSTCIVKHYFINN